MPQKDIIFLIGRDFSNHHNLQIKSMRYWMCNSRSLIEKQENKIIRIGNPIVSIRKVARSKRYCSNGLSIKDITS